MDDPTTGQPLHSMSQEDLEHLFLAELRALRMASNALIDADIEAMGPEQRSKIVRTLLIKEDRLHEAKTFLKLHGVTK